MNIVTNADDKTRFYLTPEAGSAIRDTILQQIDVSFRSYITDRVGLHQSNVSAILSGSRPTTFAMLERILSGTRIEITQCIVSFTLENTSGGIVKTADSPTLEEMLYYQEETGEGLPDLSDSESPSFSSEKPPGRLKTLLATRSWENQEESSDSSSEESQNPSTSSSQTSSHVDP